MLFDSKSVVLFLTVGVVFGSPCQQVLNRDECLVSVDSDQVTCAWCIAKWNQETASCVDRVRALSLGSGRFYCETGDDEILTRAPVMKSAFNDYEEFSESYVPVVFMHGLGDSGSNPGMKSLAASVSSKYPGMYSVAVNVANGLSSYTKDIGEQVDEFAAAVKSDPKLAKGFQAAGLSQGGLIVRVYTQLYNNPPVVNLVSLCGPQEGVGDCPGGTPEFLCNFVREDLYKAPVSFAGYWKNALDQDHYLAASRHLADWNNERDEKNSTYVKNLESVNRYSLIQALQDTVVKPHESEDHGFFKWGSNTEDDIMTFENTPGYQGDWLGLKSLNQAGKIQHFNYTGDHLRWSQEFWENSVLPLFNQKFSTN